MAFSLVYYIGLYINFLKTLKKTVDEIYLDKSGNEINVIYRNRGKRLLHEQKEEEILINSALINPDPILYPFLKGII